MARRRRRRRLDLASLVAVPIGLAVVGGAQVLGGGSLAALLHGPAAVVVFGGTIGALLISHSPSRVFTALRDAWRAFYKDADPLEALAARLIGLAIRGHRKGPGALEAELADIDDPFLRGGLVLAIDGAPPESIRRALAMEQLAREADDDVSARIWEAAAGYAPTLGILGAVLGLIQALQHLRAPGAIGGGVATAFVATVYGVGTANLLCLPMASRLREQAAGAARRRQLICEGLAAISERAHPRVVADRLRPLAPDAPRVEDVLARLGRPDATRMVA